MNALSFVMGAVSVLVIEFIALIILAIIERGTR